VNVAGREGGGVLVIEDRFLFWFHTLKNVKWLQTRCYVEQSGRLIIVTFRYFPVYLSQYAHRS